MHTCAVVNPVAGRGQVRRLWPQLLSRLLRATASLSVRWTTGPRHATALARQALADGCDRVVAVGGDGTLHEVANGFFDGASPVRPGAVLAFVPCGSGSDFRYALGMPAGLAATGRLVHGRVRAVDVLRVRHSSSGDRRGLRHALNIASVGLSGTVVRRLSPGTRLMPPRLHYLQAILRALATDAPFRICLTLDGTRLPPARSRLVAIANGPTFAAGLPIAPAATPHDGQLDVTVLHDVSVPTLLRHAPRFYRGTHPSLDGVDTYRGRRLSLSLPDDCQFVWGEADGEHLGRPPLSVEVVPGALRMQC